MTPPKREPDIEVRGFRLWRAEKGEKVEDYGTPLLTINYDEGEEMHESRSYDAIVPGYSLLVMCKKKGNEYWWAVKGKRPDGTGFVKTKEMGPLSLEEYEKELARLEGVFAFLFDTTNPLVTLGKHYNLYMGKQRSEV